jgi:antitoxin CptB
MGDLERLKWRCRRGSLELDLLMNRFLNEYYPDVPANLQTAFKRLIEYSDTTLYDLFTGKIQAQDHDIDTLVNKILGACRTYSIGS